MNVNDYNNLAPRNLNGDGRLNNSYSGDGYHLVGSPSTGTFVPKSPYGVNFENERSVKKNEKRQYKEDLDYLISLRRRLGDEEFDRRFGSDLMRRVQKMDDKFEYNKYENKNFMKNLMRQYENEATTNKDREKEKKLNDLEKDKKYLNSIEYQKYLDNQKKLEYKMKLKSENLSELDNFYKKKHEEGLKKYEEGLLNKRMNDEQVKIANDREDQYKNRFNNLNNQIYDKASNHSGYMTNNTNGSPKFNEPFHIKNDFEFNKRLAEMKAFEKDNIRKDPTAINERLKDLELNKEFENNMKNEKKGHQLNYRNYLDQQTTLRNNERSQKDNSESNQLLMPAYHYPNKPVPVAKKAIDGVDWVKNNHLETLTNGHKNYYLGDTKLRHNPIIQPLNDVDYNKYVSRQRQIYGGNSLNNSVSNIPQYSQDNHTLVKAGNQLFG